MIRIYDDEANVTNKTFNPDTEAAEKSMSRIHDSGIHERARHTSGH